MARVGGEDESEAKPPRSTSTTPKSRKGMDPDGYDRLMGITRVISPQKRWVWGRGTD